MQKKRSCFAAEAKSGIFFLNSTAGCLTVVDPRGLGSRSLKFRQNVLLSLCIEKEEGVLAKTWGLSRPMASVAVSSQVRPRSKGDRDKERETDKQGGGREREKVRGERRTERPSQKTDRGVRDKDRELDFTLLRVIPLPPVCWVCSLARKSESLISCLRNVS